MNSPDFFDLALGLGKPWIIKEVNFKQLDLDKDLHIKRDLEKGAQFLEQVGKPCKVHDMKEKTWCHLNFLYDFF